MIWSDLASLYPEIAIFIAVNLALIIGVFKFGEKEGTNSFIDLIVFAGLVTGFCLLSGVEQGKSFNGFFVSSKYIILVKQIMIIATAIVLFLARGYRKTIKTRIGSFEFSCVALTSLIGMMTLVSANHLLGLYLSIELMSLPLYVMASFERNNQKSSESGLKYFILGAVSSCLLLFGISLIYGFSGSMNYEVLSGIIYAKASIPLALLLGVIFCIIGFCFKIAAVPFHMWAPDVYQGAPTIVTAFFACVPKIASLFALIRFLNDGFYNFVPAWSQIITVLSILSMFIGSFGAIAQSNIKRMLAFSGISHVGYILIALLTLDKDQATLFPVIMYLAIYCIMNLGAFAGMLFMHKEEKFLEELNDFRGIAKTNPLFAISFSLIMFSMASIPPLAGFYAKFYLFSAALDKGLLMLTILAVIASTISAFYYIRVVKVIYFDEQLLSSNFVYSSNEIKVIFTILVLVNLLFFVLPGYLIEYIKLFL